MSEPLALISVLAGVISLSGTVISSSLTIRDTIDLLRARWISKVKRLEHYELSSIMCLILLPFTETLTTMDRNVIHADNTIVMDYRARRMAGCSMTGVAAALVAQITLTSLQQEFTPSLHWSVSALWTTSLSLSLLSVYYSFLLHHYLGSFSTATELRRAFTHRTFAAKKSAMALPSLTVAAKLWVPPYLLSLAIGCYIITLGLYLSLAWKGWWGVSHEASRGVDNRNIFICYILTVAVATVLFTIPSAIGRILEDVDNLHLYREELKHVCRSGNEYAVEETEPEKSLRESGETADTLNPPLARRDPQPSPTGSFPTDISGQSVRAGRNEPLRGIGAATEALLAAAEAHRAAGLASQNLAAELDRLVDGIVGGVRGIEGGLDGIVYG